MPGVPQLQVPTESSEQQPSPTLAVPDARAFGSSAGAGAQQLGSDLFLEGYNEFQKTSEMLAVEANTKYQISALETRSQLTALHGHAALAATPAALAKLETQRQQMLDAMPSKDSAKILANSTLRQMRIEESVIRSHFDSERNSLDKASTRRSMIAGSVSLGQMGSGFTMPELIDSQVGLLKDVATSAAKRLGLNAEESDDYVAGELQVPVHALIKAQGDTGNPQLQDTLAKYGKYLPEKAQAGAVAALSKIDAMQKSSALLKAAPLVNALGEPDKAGGSPDRLSVLQGLKAHVDDPNYAAVEEQTHRRLKLEDELNDEKGRALAAKLQGAAERGGGFDLTKPGVSPDDMEALRRTSPALFHALTKEHYAEKAMESAAGKRSAAAESAQTVKDLRGYLFELSQTSPDKIADMTVPKLLGELGAKAADGSDKYGAITNADAKGLPAMLKEMQDLHAKNNLNWIDTSVVNKLKARAGGDATARESVRNSAAYTELVTSMTEAVRRGDVKPGSPASVEDFFKREFEFLPKTGWSKILPGGTMRYEAEMETRKTKGAVKPKVDFNYVPGKGLVPVDQ